MCTIGVRHFAPDDYILFKNKDFGRPHHDDRLVLDRDVFGVVGVSTWARSDPADDVLSGISLGANSAGLFCCDANVRGAEGQSNYDELVEIHSAPAAGWPKEWLLSKPRDQTVAVTPLSGATARSNHHLELAAEGDPDVGPTTARRLVGAQRRVEAATSIEELFALQDAHDDGVTGICSHEGHQTVYSYVLRRRGESTTLYVTQGHPCVTDARIELLVPIGRDWSEEAMASFRDRYPSAEAMIEA